MKNLRILFITVIFVIISSSALSQGSKQYNKGYEAYKKGEYSIAISYFKEAAKLAPNGGYSYFWWLGMAYYRNGQYQEAVDAFKKDLSLPHDHDQWYKAEPSWKWLAEAYKRLAEAYNNRGEYDLAISAQKKVIEIAPDSSQNYVTLSKYYRGNKQYDEAITAAKRVIELKPDANAYISIGAAYGAKKQYGEAIKTLKKSIEINPKNNYAYNLMGGFLIEKNAYNEAVAAYKKAIEINPSDYYAILNLSQAYYNMGSYDDALAPINKTIELRTIHGIGIAFDVKDNYPVVKEVIDPGPAKKVDLQIGDKIIEIDGKSTKGWNDEKIKSSLRGTDGSQVILTIERSDNKIKKTVTREKIVMPYVAENIGFRSLIFRQKGSLSEALSDAEWAWRLNSSLSWTNARLALGASYLDRGQYNESVKLLLQMKGNTTALLLLATAYTKLEKIKEAIDIYLSIPEEDLSSKNIPLMNDRMVLLQTFKPLVKEHRDKAGSFESKEQYKEAISELSEALKMADDNESLAILESMFSIIRRNPLLSEVPEDARKYVIRGEMLIKEGNFEQAATEFKKAIQIAPYVSKLYYNTALMNSELKKYPEAIRYMKIYIQADPDAPNNRAAKDEIIKWEFMMEKEK